MDDEQDKSETSASSRLARVLAGVPNIADLSRRSGVQRRMLDRYKAGAEPSLASAARIARALGLPLDALVNDTGVSMTDIEVPERAVDPQTESRSGEVVLVPLLNVEGSAGPGLASSDIETVSVIPFSRALLRRYGVRPEAAHFIRARGDSMLPTITDGAVVLVDASVRRVRDDGIYALVVGDDVRLKRVQKAFDGSLILKSDNAAYANEALSPADAERLRVQGRLFWTERLL